MAASPNTCSRAQPTNEYFAQGRIDHRHVDRQPNTTPPIVFAKERSRNRCVTLEQRHIFSPAVLNTLKAGYSRSTTEADAELQPVNTRGNLGRNTLIGPGLANSDLSVVRMFKLFERAPIQFRAEMFNFANHPNFATPDWGRITRTVTTSRPIQLGLKVTF